MLRAVVLDIEGTTSATAFVQETLFPYARARLAAWVAAHRAEPRVAAQLDAVRAALGAPEADEAAVVAQLIRWSDEDAKVTPLKALQGWIWDEGFAAGALTSHLFPDVAPALRQWAAAGHTLWVFSSGSVAAQQAWFGHSPAGDLRPLLAGYFDTANAGPKRERDSYARIAATIGQPPARIVFLSDVTAELDAARAAGWQTVGVRRPGEPCYAAGVGDHLAVTSFAALDLSGAVPRVRAPA
ncbi:MAG TPA: acireductone synthase [Chloroflexota bacterium]|nr:acireductone synthase [Chloroflexota bacterium]